MAGTLHFEWDRRPAVDRMMRASTRALESLRPDAQTVWVGTVPIRTGFLRDSWFSMIVPVEGGVILVVGAGAPYAIFVELGTIHMAPRAPIRRTAEQVAPMVLPRLRTELAAA